MGFYLERLIIVSTDFTLDTTPRSTTGSGNARALRRAGQIPGIIYGGDNKKPQMVTVKEADLSRLLRAGRLSGGLVTLRVGKRKIDTLPREIQLDPVRDNFIHCDFLRVEASREIQLAVPVRYHDEEESPGLKRGGALNIVRHEVDIVCLPQNIPDMLNASLSGLDFNDSLHISAVTLPEGVSLVISDRDFTLATISSPTSETEEEEVESDDNEAV